MVGVCIMLMHVYQNLPSKTGYPYCNDNREFYNHAKSLNARDLTGKRLLLVYKYVPNRFPIILYGVD